jgi:hypothetical protein
MTKKISLFDFDGLSAAQMDNPFEVVRLGNNETAIIPFTPDGEEIDLHFCDEPEINNYVPCNGPDCTLCRIGRKKEARMLIPVFLPTSGEIGVLAVSKSRRPSALFPQLMNIMKAGKPVGMFVSREGSKYVVSTFELGKDMETGEAEIKRFLEKYEAGEVSLASVYPTISNEELADVEGIARMMALKGISKDAVNQRS